MFAVFLVAWAAALPDGGLEAARPSAAPPDLAYQLSFDAPLAVVTATACFARLPPVLEPGASAFERALRHPTVAIAGQRTRLEVRGGQLVLPRSGVPGCVRFEVDLGAAEREAPSHFDLESLHRVGRDLLLTPDLFLWQPPEIPERWQVTAEIHLAPGQQLSVPWIPLSRAPPRFALDRSTFNFDGLMAVGRFPSESFSAYGTRLEYALLDRPVRASRAGIRRWLEEALRTVSLLYGTFPVDRLQVLIVPVAGEGVQFGMAERGGGPTVVLLLGSDGEESQLPGEWVAVHEFTHLVLPFVAREDAWLSEGIATYYQTVLRARSGHFSEQEAWQELEDGFARGRAEAAGTMADASARLRQDHAYMRVYWSGAAIALLADVALRSRGSGSLDACLAALHRGGAREARYVPAREILASFDATSGTSVFRTLAQRWVGSDRFPDLGPAYAALGLTRVAGQIVLGGDARARALRRAVLLGSGAPAPQ